MKFKIACPHCDHSLTLSDPKVGKYKPTCSKCNDPFRIVVEDGDPPKIRVGKLSAKPTSEQPASGIETKKSDSKPINAPNFEATLPALSSNQPLASSSSMTNETVNGKSAAYAPKTSISESSFESNSLEAPKASGFDATLPSESDTKPHALEGTIGLTRSAENTVSGPTAANSEHTIDHDTKGSQNRSIQSVDFSVAVNALEQSGAPEQESQNRHSLSSDIPIERLGGYKILQELGAGGMGKVYLASQISLDRKCAVKTIQASWAKNPKAIARFIREAYAAAQLTHHNVVQIYDLGQENGTNFFSMELVSGGSLDEQLKKKGKFPPKLATTLILQAARGLKFAHDHGMVHRDIKPANLMLTADGLVKIADMGLIKTPHSDETRGEMDADQQALMLASARSQFTLAGASMGTPAYMSPEQAEDAAGVDRRADIYSLGCTFYAMLTGKPPFDGATLLEVITKHRQEKLTRPEVIVGSLPPKLGDIIERMTEKNPDDRYQDLEEVIEDLEIFLELREDRSKAKMMNFDASHQTEGLSERSSVDQAADSESKNRPVTSPAELPAEVIAKFQELGKAIDATPLRLAERFIPPTWLVLCASISMIAMLMALGSGVSMITASAKSLASAATDAVASVTGGSTESVTTSDSGSTAATHFSLLTSRLKFAMIWGLTLFLAPLISIVLAGRDGMSVVAKRYRQSFLSGGWWNSIYAVFATIALILLTHFFGLWVVTIVAIIVSTIAGAGYYFGVQRPMDAHKTKTIEKAQSVIKQLRLQGTDDQAIQFAIAKHAGRRWEELHEGLFGYDAMRTMRSRNVTGRKSSKLWSMSKIRDRLIDRLEDQVTEQKRVEEQRMLARAEKAELIAAGVSLTEAKKRADDMAASMVDAATETRKTLKELAAGNLTDHAAQAKRQQIKQMISQARSGNVGKSSNASRALQFVLNQLLGGKFRLAIAVVLLLTTGLWINQNAQLLEHYWEQTKSTVTKIAQEGVENVAQNVTESTQQAIAASSEYRWQPVLVGQVTHENVIYLALAGLIMLWGAFFAGWKPSLFFVPVTLAILAIPLFL